MIPLEAIAVGAIAALNSQPALQEVLTWTVVAIMGVMGVAQKVSISICHFDFQADFNVTLSEAKGLTSCDRFFATLRMTFWAKPRFALRK
jgi:hypothetical protein